VVPCSRHRRIGPAGSGCRKRHNSIHLRPISDGGAVTWPGGALQLNRGRWA
jgi:hypothetical protein